MNIAIITARGGSKRIPRKNIKEFCGKPIIGYSIQAALKSKLFERVMVSTDDNEIAEVARSLGAEVPFLRSEKNSDDHATTLDVLKEVVEKLEREKISSDFMCCLYPTAPFVRDIDLIESFKEIKAQSFDTLIPVTEFSYPIQRALSIKDNRLNWREPDNMVKRSQDLESFYHDVGQFYWLKSDKIMKLDSVINNKSGSFIVDPKRVQDIDTL